MVTDLGVVMNDYKNIVTCLINQYDLLHMRNQYPNRVILGIEIVKILDEHCRDCYFEYKAYNDDFLFMGLPVTIDYKDKYIMMVCAGNEADGRYWLNKE